MVRGTCPAGISLHGKKKKGLLNSVLSFGGLIQKKKKKRVVLQMVGVSNS